MTLEPLLDASPAIQFHVATVVPSALIGGLMLIMRKGTYLHRMAGRLWIALMVLTALSSFFIHEINLFFGFSPIHILSVVVLVSAVEVIRSARRRNFVRHKRLVKSLYFGGIGIAGLFTLLPGRIMHDVVLTTALAEPAQGAVPVAAQATTGAPVWVWPLLVALIALGVSRMRDREMPVWRLLLLPVILSSVSVLGIIARDLSSAGLSASLAGAVAGLLAGSWSLRGVAVVRLAGNRVRVKGEAVSLIAILGIFATHFAAGTLAATAPHILEMQGVAELFALLPVFFATLMTARALAQAGYNPLRATREQLTPQAEC
jgi:uncharacterized membrane protein